VAAARAATQGCLDAAPHAATRKASGPDCNMHLIVIVLALTDSSRSSWCPLAIPPFRIRAIRRSQNAWTGDVYLTEWTPGANVTLTWSSPMRLTRANHANLSFVGSRSASFVLQASGPDDGSGRVMCDCDRAFCAL